MKKEIKPVVIILTITLICFLNSVGVLLNAIGVRNINNKVSAVARTVEVLHNIEKEGEYTCKNLDEREEGVVSRINCRNSKAMYEIWTYEDGRVDVVVR